MERKEFRKLIEGHLKAERVIRELGGSSPLMDVLREMGFSLPPERRRGQPRRDVAKCIVAALLYREGLTIKEISDAMGLSVASGNNWSQTAKRFTDDGENILNVFEAQGLVLHKHERDVIEWTQMGPLGPVTHPRTKIYQSENGTFEFCYGVSAETGECLGGMLEPIDEGFKGLWNSDLSNRRLNYYKLEVLEKSIQKLYKEVNDG